jgi:DNA-binding CsgD family transcriptional regulator/tetratricopeptide (TPR) repeat protein
MGRNLRRCRVAVVITYRLDGLGRGHPLRPLLAELARSGVEQVQLDTFERDYLATMMAGIFGRPISRSLLDDVLARSGGNAFYAEELAAAARAGEPGLPRSLREVVLAQIERLPEIARQVLPAVAVAGRTVRHVILEQIVELSEEELDGALVAGVSAGVLVAVAPEGYRFRHALIGEVVDAEMMPARRRSLHRRVAEALAAEAKFPTGGTVVPGLIGELANHWEAANEPVRALAASMSAGQAAQRLAAPLEALAQYRRVLSLWARVREPEALAGVDHQEVLVAAARAAHSAGALAEAVALAGAAMIEIDATGDRIDQALIRERLARYTFLNNDSEAAMALYEDAAGLLTAEPPSTAKARVLAARAQGLLLLDRHAEAVRQCDEAIEIARAVGDTASEGHAANTLGTALAQLGRATEGIDYLRTALALADRRGDPDDLLRAHYNLFWPLMSLGRSKEAIELARAGIETAARFGCMGSVGHQLQTTLTQALVAVGRLTEADALLSDLAATGEGVSRLRFLRASADLAVAVGDVQGAQAAVDAALVEKDTDPLSADDIWLLSTAAEVALAAGRFAEARTAIDHVRHLHAERDSLLEGIESATLGIVIEAEAARRGVHLDTGASNHAQDLLIEARTLAADLISRGGQISPETAAWLALAEAEAAAAAGTPDFDKWTAAIDNLDAMGLVLKAATARLRYAEAVLTRRGTRQAAIVLISAAHQAANAAGARPLVDQANRLASRAHLDIRLADQPPPSKAKPATRYGITVRESEVLRHLATGQTNRQIADLLFISEKTASVHVSNLLRKLGVTNRIEAGAIAQQFDEAGADTRPGA